MVLLLKTSGGGTTVVGWSLTVVTAVTIGFLLRRRVSIDLQCITIGTTGVDVVQVKLPDRLIGLASFM